MIKNFEITLNHIMTVINRTFNSLDDRLINHGEEVAYVMFNMLKAQGKYSREEIRDICAIATFHDIGVYKICKLDKDLSLNEIEDEDCIAHSVYGALFMKYFSPLSDLHEIILNNAFDYMHLKNITRNYICDNGFLLSFADKIDLYHIRQNNRNIILDEKNYSKEHIDLFYKAVEKYDFINKIYDNTYKEELTQLFSEKYLTREEVIEYSKMLAYSIDFRSESTVEHTITVEAISNQIGKLMNINSDKLSLIKVSAALHDIGKIGIPMNILEKPGKLTAEEFEIIKGHTTIGYDILSGLNIDDIRDIVVRHHEKIDGSGYPFGLKGKDINVETRIVAIADIIGALIGTRSYKKEFSKDKVISILREMADDNKIDADITDLFIDNYDYVIEEAKKEAHILINKYLNMKSEYLSMVEEIKANL